MEELSLMAGAETADLREIESIRMAPRTEVRDSLTEDLSLITETEITGQMTVTRILEIRMADFRIRKMTEIRETRIGIRMKGDRAAARTAEECPVFRKLPWNLSRWKRKAE